MKRCITGIVALVLGWSGLTQATVYNLSDLAISGNYGSTWEGGDNTWGLSEAGWVWNGSNGPSTRFLIQNFNESVPNNDVSISIPNLASGQYEVGLYWFSHNSTTQQITLQGTVEGVSTSATSTGDAGSFNWANLGTFTVSDGTMNIGLGDASSNQAGDWWFSFGQVSAVAVPEPATLSLILLSLGFFGRKR